MTKNWRWFISKTLRDAVELHKQVIKLLAAQRDLLKPSRVDELEKALDALQDKLTGPVDKAAVLDEMDTMMMIADRVLFPYPNPTARDWVEMFLVVAVLVLAFRTFFFQPFKIPTGSMQPTLYGITIENLMDYQGTGKVEQGILTATKTVFQPKHLGRTVTFANGKQASITQFKDNQHVKLSPPTAIDKQDFTVSFKLPGTGGMAVDWLHGYSYHSLQSKGNWRLIQINPSRNILPLITKQTFLFEDMDSGKKIKQSIWFPPLDGNQNHMGKFDSDKDHGQPELYKEFSKGDYVFKMRAKTGDHLFVNRVTFNFRRPRRGDICVFTTKGVRKIEKELFYIKRLIALGNESISIGEDRHVLINGRRLDANDPGFEFLYDFPITYSRIDTDSGKTNLISHAAYLARGSIFSGHINNSHNFYNGYVYKDQNLQNPENKYRHLAPFFNNSMNELTLKPDHYMMFGDNTVNSSDSRFWGQLPMRNVIGKSSFVYWPPLSSRFGWSHR